jgi:hypothetical protein
MDLLKNLDNMSKILTAEEFHNQYFKNISKEDLSDSQELVMIEFAKYHVTEALKQASEIADYGIYQNDDGQEPFHHESNIFVNKDAILNSYNLENIK